MSWFSRRSGRDLQKFFGSLTHVRAGRLGYTKTDRYRDFRAVFATPEGRKVLAQIIDYCEGAPVIEADVSDTHGLAFKAGKRNVGLWMVQTLNAEPLEGEKTNAT